MSVRLGFILSSILTIYRWAGQAPAGGGEDVLLLHLAGLTQKNQPKVEKRCVQGERRLRIQTGFEGTISLPVQLMSVRLGFILTRISQITGDKRTGF